MSNAASTPEFRQILQSLYDSGKYRDSGSTLKAAWAEYRQRHGSGTVQQRRYAMRKTAEGMNPRSPRGIRSDIPRGKKKPRRKSIGRKLSPTIMKSLIAEGYSPSDAMREAWKIQKGKNPRKKKTRRSCPSCGGQMSGSVCLTCLQKRNPHKKRRVKRRKNPIAVYNPRGITRKFHGVNPRVRMTKLPASQVEIRYKRTGGQYAGKFFKHSFKSGAALFGMPDGSLLLKSSTGRKLWGTV